LTADIADRKQSAHRHHRKAARLCMSFAALVSVLIRAATAG
jgi:hypothetical protein